LEFFGRTVICWEQVDRKTHLFICRARPIFTFPFTKQFVCLSFQFLRVWRILTYEQSLFAEINKIEQVTKSIIKSCLTERCQIHTSLSTSGGSSVNFTECVRDASLSCQPSSSLLASSRISQPGIFLIPTSIPNLPESKKKRKKQKKTKRISSSAS